MGNMNGRGWRNFPSFRRGSVTLHRHVVGVHELFPLELVLLRAFFGGTLPSFVFELICSILIGSTCYRTICTLIEEKVNRKQIGVT
jgi:hypothetical protein